MITRENPTEDKQTPMQMPQQSQSESEARRERKASSQEFYSNPPSRLPVRSELQTQLQAQTEALSQSDLEVQNSSSARRTIAATAAASRLHQPPSEGPPCISSPIPKDNNNEDDEEHMSLLELGEETMAQAMLIFLLADLRSLSATGRIRTLFEHLSLDNDRSPRLSSDDYAGRFDNETAKGVTARHIMAILLVEILREAEEAEQLMKEKSKRRSRRRRGRVHKPALLSPWAATATEAPTAGVNARKIFKRDIQAANGMPSLLHCYNEMLSNDVNPRIARVSRKLYPLDQDLQHLQQFSPLRPDAVADIDRKYSDEHSIAVTPMNSAMTEVPDEDLSIGEESLPYHSNHSKIRSYSQPIPLLSTTPPPTSNMPNQATFFSPQDSLHTPDKFGTATYATANINPTLHGSLYQMPRRASTNFQPSHFNPNVDDDDDDDSIQLEPEKTRPKTPEDFATNLLPAQFANIMHASTPALSFRLPFPSGSATRLPFPGPKGSATRQQQELEQIAKVQNKLLDWDNIGASTEFQGSMDGNQASHHSRTETWQKSNNNNNNNNNNKIPLGRQTMPVSEVDGDESLATVAEEHLEPAAATPSNFIDFKGNDVVQNIPEYHDSDTIRELILQAIDKRDFSRLGFLTTFFREGTVSHILANSPAEMVWLSDWHTQYECTYAISTDKEKQKVLLAFRGAYTESDWRHIVDWYDTATSNPVEDQYPNRPANIRLHSGFHKYLFRVRKDTQTTKYSEIAAKLAHYCKITGPNTRITITGHSLGAALATIFSLYASTEERFTLCGAIECVTFGSPCIGNWRFAGAVKHQENVGKLRIAKFHVKGDSVPHLPPALVRYSSRGAQYWHSGIDVSLPYIRKGKVFQTLLGQPKPKITYWDPDEESYFGSLLRQVREYYVWNLPLRVWRFALFHTLVEHKRRMALVNKSDPNSLLTKYSLKELYEMREDLTRRPFWRRQKKGKDKKR